ncbi:hypothetical protein D3C75_1213840 [compost metagenome]
MQPGPIRLLDIQLGAEKNPRTLDQDQLERMSVHRLQHRDIVVAAGEPGYLLLLEQRLDGTCVIAVFGSRLEVEPLRRLRHTLLKVAQNPVVTAV